MELTTTIENFFGVYILCNQSAEKRFSGRCYIGYTVNPNRRIKQHNRGKDFGGARKTSDKGPWKMVLIVHGFQNNISALQFEWAWQNPKISVRLKHNPNITSKRRNETNFLYNFRILTEMLSTGPWNRLPLVIRWLAPEFKIEFSPHNLPPSHMKICSGLVNVKKKSKRKNKNSETSKDFDKRKYECHLCMNLIENVERSKLVCLNAKCKFTSHVICLAKLWLVDGNNHGQYVPIEGDCPLCETHCLWGDLIQKKNSCDDKDNVNVTDDETDNDESDDDEEYNGEHDIDVISLSSDCDSTEETNNILN